MTKADLHAMRVVHHILESADWPSVYEMAEAKE